MEHWAEVARGAKEPTTTSCELRAALLLALAAQQSLQRGEAVEIDSAAHEPDDS